jgi:hypothetical protein
VSYQPQPGTIAFRAIEWLKLQEAGTQVTASIWAEAIDIDPSTLQTCVKGAVQAGLVKEGTKHGLVRPKWFSLGDGVPVVRHVPDDEDGKDPLPPRTAAPEVKPLPGAMLPGVRGDEPVAPAPPLKVPKFTGEAPEPEPRAHGGRPMTQGECAAAEEKPAKLVAFDCWLSGVSGELVLQGVKVDADGDAIIDPEKVAAIRRVLLGVPA